MVRALILGRHLRKVGHHFDGCAEKRRRRRKGEKLFTPSGGTRKRNGASETLSHLVLQRRRWRIATDLRVPMLSASTPSSAVVEP